MKRVLIGSPIRQKKNILEQFLIGLDEIELQNCQVSFYFVDDNKDPGSSELLSIFKNTNSDVILIKGEDIVANKEDNAYVCDANSHHWRSENIARITKFKDWIIDYCVENGFDYLFLVDSDIVLDRRSLSQLLSRNVDIVSNVFWTQWHPGAALVPQCFWMPDPYQQYKAFNVKLDPKEANQMRDDMFNKLKLPGIYKVDGLGACTLISKKALMAGVRFKEVPNLSIPGEDRHFCIRAGVLGFDLYMDTVYPAYHIFREEYLSRVDEFKRDGFKFDMCQTPPEINEVVDVKDHRIIRFIFRPFKKVVNRLNRILQ